MFAMLARPNSKPKMVFALLALILASSQSTSNGQSSPASGIAKTSADATAEILTSKEWRQLDRAVDRGLSFLASRQQPDGSFPTLATGQPGVTSLCVMAFLSRGHFPNQGPYGEQLNRAVDFVLSTQQESGLFSNVPPDSQNEAGHAALYNHAISGLMLTELYGMAAIRERERMRVAIVKAIAFARKTQQIRKAFPGDQGGWRYLSPGHRDYSDLSVVSWFLMFFRSARNAEFEVPKVYVDDAMGYVRRCFHTREKAFVYRLTSRNDPRAFRRGVVGAGIVALSLAGQHNTEMAQQAGQWVLRNGFDEYNGTPHYKDRYHYSAYYCSQAMFQLGGKYWSTFFPPLMRTLVKHQRRDQRPQRQRTRPRTNRLPQNSGRPYWADRDKSSRRLPIHQGTH